MIPGYRCGLYLVGVLVVAALIVDAADAQTKVRDISPDHAAQMAKGLQVFKTHVRGVLVKKCLRCHGGAEVESDFNLADREGLLKGGLKGPAVVPGKSRDSLLLKLVNHAEKPHMPHKGNKLQAAAIARIAEWIDFGAPYDGPLSALKASVPSWTQRTIAPEARQFWSFQPLKRTAAPVVRDEKWCKTAIDGFILARLETAHIQPNPPAEKRQLIRRAYFDLIGLPPPPDEVQRFLSDTSREAYDNMIGRLLDSPHYGERWARHWLDLARFAESHGFEHDYDRPTAYHYRDFVIKALNRDMPYDQFVRWQIAGDEFAPDDNLALKATGFLAAGVHSTQITKNEVAKHRYDEMDDMLATIGTSMLGLTIGCARCHDHKYDPIPQADYYRLLSTFTTTVRSEMNLEIDREGYRKAKAEFDKSHHVLVDALRQYELDQEAAIWPWYRMVDPEWLRLNRAVEDNLKTAPKPATVKVLVSTEGLPAVRLHTQGDDFLKETHFLRRGDPDQKEDVASPGFLQALLPAAYNETGWKVSPPAGWRTSYRRRALANWLTDVDQGAGRLLARVIVNRLWQHHLGRGLVATPSDFGHRGEPPSHPELLDWLATELVQNGWSLKHIHKLIVTSSVYKQSSQYDEAKSKLDRENKLCWRVPPHRLEAEVIRDGLLSVSGMLDPKMYGPGTLDEASKRRSIYFTVKRSKLVPMMTIFDAPEALGGMAERPTTTIAPQALYLMNNPQVRGYALGFARRISPDEKTSLPDAVKAAYRIALARWPQRDELADSVAFISQQLATYSGTDRRYQALADFCQVLLCLNEFVYVD